MSRKSAVMNAIMEKLLPEFAKLSKPPNILLVVEPNAAILLSLFMVVAGVLACGKYVATNLYTKIAIVKAAQIFFIRNNSLVVLKFTMQKKKCL